MQSLEEYIRSMFEVDAELRESPELLQWAATLNLTQALEAV